MAQNPSPTRLDQNQIFQRSFDEANDRIRVDATATIEAGALEIYINAADDSIKSWTQDGSGNPISSTISGPKRALDVNLVNNINANVEGNVNSVESGTVRTAFNEVTSVASGSPVSVTTLTATGPTRLKIVEVSGTNIAEFTILVNSTAIHKKRTYYGFLDSDFQFSKGYQLQTGDVITVQVEHNQSSLGDFSAFILVLEDS